MNEQIKRFASFQAICSRPEKFKICCGCESIIKRGLSICPACKTYRFIEDHDEIKKQAAFLMEKPRETPIEDDYS